MMTWKEFDRLFVTNKIVDIEFDLVTEVGIVPTKIPRYERRATVRQLIELKERHKNSKPKRFFWRIIPNPTYSIEMIDWSFINKRLEELTNFKKPAAMDDVVIWYD